MVPQSPSVGSSSMLAVLATFLISGGVPKLAIKILSGPIATSAIEQNLAVTAGKKYAGQFFR